MAAHTQTVAHLRDFDVVTVDRQGYRLKSLSHNKAGLEISTIDYKQVEDELGDFPHYMLKEIFEQTMSIQNAVRGRLNEEESTAQLGGLNLSPQDLRDIDRILRTAIERNATDINLQAGLPPVFRVQKKLVQYDAVKLTAEQVQKLVFDLMTDHQKRLLSYLGLQDGSA